MAGASRSAVDEWFRSQREFRDTLDRQLKRLTCGSNAPLRGGYAAGTRKLKGLIPQVARPHMLLFGHRGILGVASVPSAFHESRNGAEAIRRQGEHWDARTEPACVERGPGAKLRILSLHRGGGVDIVVKGS